MAFKNPKKNIEPVGEVKPLARGKKPRKCYRSDWIEGKGVPCQTKPTMPKGRAANPDSPDGRIVVNLGRHIETLNMLQEMWKCTRTEALLRLLRPAYAPVRDAFENGLDAFRLREKVFWTSPDDWDDMGEMKQ